MKVNFTNYSLLFSKMPYNLKLWFFNEANNLNTRITIILWLNRKELTKTNFHHTLKVRFAIPEQSPSL